MSMFGVTHFSKLSTHKTPTLQLYRRLIRHANHIPSTLKEPVVQSVRETFRKNKKTMSPHAARDQMDYGYKCEEILREACISKNETGIERISQFLREHEQIIAEKLLAKKNRVDLVKVRGYNPLGAAHSDMSMYNTPVKRGSEAYESLQAKSRLDTFRKRTIRSLRRTDSLSIKRALDLFYIDVFLAPQLRNQKYKVQNEAKMARETTFKPVRVSNLMTPNGPFAQLLVPGQGRRTNRLRAIRVRNALMDQTAAKIIQVDQEIDLAKQVAWWERHVEQSNQFLPVLQAEWTGPLKRYRDLLIERRQKEGNKNYLYRRILLAKKNYIENINRGKVRRNQEKWAERRPTILHKGIVLDTVVYKGYMLNTNSWDNTSGRKKFEQN